MGYFANLYTVEATANEDYVEVETAVYGGGAGERMYFSWGAGQRAGNLYPYAHGTLFSSEPLNLLPGYPLIEHYPDVDNFLLEASFTPRHQDDPVLLHILLPEKYVPRRDRSPLSQPCDPFVHIHQGRMVITYPAVGTVTTRFWVNRMQEDESLSDYDETKILKPIKEDSLRTEFEINLGVFKVKFSQG
jgi:hypothetical protein